MKRRCVDDTDNDDDFLDEDDYDNTIGSPSQSCQAPDRKRRRGIIEKRRRDRINHSLTELRRLVPAAFEKQGATKLEKAEILKMTVDHLKMLQLKGSNGPGVDTTSLAMDFRSVGFRECTAEVARYLVAIEGLDSQDPLRVRLISHLQYYSLHARTTSSSSSSSLPPTPSLNSSTGGWSHVTQNVVVPPPYPVTPMTSLMTSYPATQGGLRQMEQPISTGGGASSFVDGERFTVDARFTARLGSNDDRMMTSGYGTLSGARRFQPNAAAPGGMGVGVSFSEASQLNTQGIFSGLNGHFMQGGGNYPSAISSVENNVYSNLSASSSSSASSMLLQCVKPYRPWGSESLMASLMSTY